MDINRPLNFTVLMMLSNMPQVFFASKRALIWPSYLFFLLCCNEL